ncbi:unnamed protein product [Oppiella nova]|uniref:Out at first protein n=1 Tax=Oppiella nova TaxID=334625 RepID=A0A7R9LF98_9ACAR|nr:unnamed protein product [Oppiella nova]CAG2163070.1 unnamed protein product [Oppiella nova]
MSWCVAADTTRKPCLWTLRPLLLCILSSLVWRPLAEHMADSVSPEDNLVINVKNGGEEVYQQVITANTTDDVITVDFLESDGSLITQFIDFKAEVQIFRIYRLGELDLNESQYKVYCFVTHLLRNEFISSDAMSKLRQRNPGAIRQPEEDKGKEFFEMDLNIVLDKSSIISQHLPKVCSDATNQTFTREIDLRFWANTGAVNRDIIALTSSVHKNPTAKPVQSCIVSDTEWEPCLCHIQMCIAWYPCALKYCKTKDPNSSKLQTYRCGIKTCRKCRDFQFYSQFRQNCLWD